MKTLSAAALTVLLLTSQANAAGGYSSFNSGVAARNRGDADVAIQLLSAAIAAPDLPPQFLPIAYFDRGGAYADTGKLDEAISDFSQSLKLKPDIDGYRQRGFCYVRKKQFDPAEADFTAVIAQRPDLAAGRIVRARLYAAEKKLDQAQSDLDAAIADEPDNATVYLDRSDVYLMESKYEQSLADINRAIDIAGSSYRTYFARAITYQSEGKYGDAADDFKSALDKSPSDFSALFNIGWSQWELGKFADAEQTFDRAAKEHPTDTPAYVLFGLHLSRIKAGKPDAEFEQKAAALDQTKWPAPIIGVLLGKSPPDSAFKAAAGEAAGDADGHTCEANFYIGELKLQQGDAAAAKQMLQAAASGCPHDFTEWPASNAELARLP